MRRISWIVTIPFALIVVVFALTNREAASLQLWPLDIYIEMPIFLLILLSLLIGFLIGASIMWLSSGRQRQRARKANFQAVNLERDVRDLERRLARTEARANEAASGTALKPHFGGSQRPAA